MGTPSIFNAVQRTASFRTLSQHLLTHHGIEVHVARERLHYIKQSTGRGGADDVLFDLTGNVYAATTGEYLGSLTQGGRKGPS